MAQKKNKKYTNPFFKANSPLVAHQVSSLANIQEAIALQQQGRLAQAEAIYRKILAIEPENANALHLLGLIFYQNGSHQDALEKIGLAIQINPNVSSYHSNLGLVLRGLKRLDAAVDSFDKAIALKPDNAGAYSNRGISLQELRQFDAAVASFNKAIALQPDFAEAFSSRGVALHQLKQFDSAVDSFEKAILLRNDYPEAYSNLGNALKELKQIDAAIENYNKSIALKPNFAEAFSNRGISLQELKQIEAAVADYDKAIALKPDYAEACYNRGNALKELKQLDAAIASYDKAIVLKPDYAEAYYNRANALHEHKRFDAAIVSYDKALALKPDYHYLLGMRQHTKLFICDWRNLSESLIECEAALASLKPAVSPFVALTLFDKPHLHLASSKIFVDSKYPQNKALGDIPKRPGGGKVRLGYFSADLYFHPVAIWLAEQLENHDKSKFELFAFSFRSDKHDPMRARLEAAFDHFIAVDKMSDLEVAKLSRELGIDIALDLGGFTTDCRPGIFAARAAPIQVSHLGFPGSMGAEFIDYLISDVHAIPESAQTHYCEKIAYVPCAYTYDRQRHVSDEPLSRAQFGLPEKGFVFTCQNGCQKLMPEVFGIWMDILKAVPGSVLWLLEPHPSAVANLTKEAQARGVARDRLVFTKRETVAADQERARIGRYLASYRLADLFLDTWPYNAGTTAIDALWAGLPVLTKAGLAAVARMAASALQAIEVPELIVSTAQEYKALAVQLASDPQRLKRIKDKVQENKAKSALFDVVGNTRHIEAAYTKMYERYQADLAAQHFYAKYLAP